jgi:hypothetical protein
MRQLALISLVACGSQPPAPTPAESPRVTAAKPVPVAAAAQCKLVEPSPLKSARSIGHIGFGSKLIEEAENACSVADSI